LNGEPFVLIGREANKRIIKAVDIAAKKQGIAIGMSVTHANALVPNLHMYEAVPEQDKDALENLTQWALQRYSPIVAADHPDGLFIDATGVAHLFNGEQAMLKDMLSKLQSFGIHARASMAPTYGAAYSCSHYHASSITIIEAHELDKVLAPLPITALRLPNDIVEGLIDLGFETI
jgi:protein ImuB